ncbi:MAG: RDD family protein [Gammaproteobacteria bacterium]|nr:RDD family protein [Gammaproteobacteria bacterium]
MEGQPSAAAAEPRYVGFWARFLAMIIDSILITVVLALIIGAFFGQEYLQQAVAGDPAASASLGLAYLIQLLLPAAIIIAFWIYRSATPGKMVISAEIVDAKSLGKPSTIQLILRYVGYYVSTIVLCLGFLWVAFDARKQGWHDKIAGTLVVKRR